MPSGPVDLWDIRFLSSFVTPLHETCIVSITGAVLAPISGRAVLPSAVKAETNWRLRISAFILGSLWRMSPAFSKETPSWSDRAPSLLLELGSLLTRSAMCWLYACLQTSCASLRSCRNRSQSRCLSVHHFLVALLVCMWNQDLSRTEDILEGTWVSSIWVRAVRISRSSRSTSVEEENLLT